MLQTNYGYSSQRNVPGGLADSSPRSTVSRANGETSPLAVKFGYGVVQGDVPGTDVKLPTSASTAAQFEGIVLSDMAEHDLDGMIRNNPTRVLGVLEWGRVWVRVPEGLTITYGEKAYLAISGADAGKFTNESAGALDVKAKFISAVDSGDIAAVELYNAPRA
jgi:hypothetical protein